MAERLAAKLEADSGTACDDKAAWLEACAAKKAEWSAYKAARFAAAPIADEVWQRPALGQPAAIKIVADFAKRIGAAKLFDAGDVQANGFQIVEDDRTGDTFTETGASYMGFAASGLLASGIADKPRYTIAFCGDGIFMMNPQILIDGVEHGVKGMIVIFDNRRMAAITGLQMAQYGAGFKTNDRVAVDYVRLAGARGGRQCGARPASPPTALRQRSRPRTSTTGCRSCTCPSTPATTSSAASAPGANGTSATGARTCRRNGSSRICRSGRGERASRVGACAGAASEVAGAETRQQLVRGCAERMDGAIAVCRVEESGQLASALAPERQAK